MGASSYIFTQMTRLPEMTQIVRPLIHGRFIKILQNDENRPTLYLWVLASFCIKILMKLQYMKGRTIWVILQNHNEAPINEVSENLRYFKSRVFGEKNILYDYV